MGYFSGWFILSRSKLGVGETYQRLLLRGATSMGEKVLRAKSTKKCKLHNQTLNELAKFFGALQIQVLELQPSTWIGRNLAKFVLKGTSSIAENVLRAKSTKKCKLHNQTFNELAMFLARLLKLLEFCGGLEPGRRRLGNSVRSRVFIDWRNVTETALGSPIFAYNNLHQNPGRT